MMKKNTKRGKEKKSVQEYWELIYDDVFSALVTCNNQHGRLAARLKKARETIRTLRCSESSDAMSLKAPAFAGSTFAGGRRRARAPLFLRVPHDCHAKMLPR